MAIVVGPRELRHRNRMLADRVKCLEAENATLRARLATIEGSIVACCVRGEMDITLAAGLWPGSPADLIARVYARDLPSPEDP